MLYLTYSPQEHLTWNKGKLMGQKPPLKLKEVWAIRTRLQMAHKTRELAMFNLAIDSKLRSCDLLKLRVRWDIGSWKARSAISASNWMTRSKSPNRRIFRENPESVLNRVPAC